MHTWNIWNDRGNASIAYASSFNNILNHENRSVVLRFSPNLVSKLGWSEAWMNRILALVYWLWSRLVRPSVCTHKTGKMSGNTYIACGVVHLFHCFWPLHLARATPRYDLPFPLTTSKSSHSGDLDILNWTSYNAIPTSLPRCKGGALILLENVIFRNPAGLSKVKVL